MKVLFKMPFNKVTVSNIRIVVTHDKNESRMKYIHKKNPPISKSKIDDNNSASYINTSFDEYCGECSADDLNDLK